jgi:5-methylcytosine-specific restriction protein A
MSLATTIKSLEPKKHLLIMDLLAEAAVDVTHWANYKGKSPAANPKYCYNWSFQQAGERVAVCLWYSGLHASDGKIVYSLDARNARAPRNPQGATWQRRRDELDKHIQLAYTQQLPIRVIIVEGTQGDPSAANPKASRVAARLLDREPWAVLECNFETGECLLVRGEIPAVPATSAADVELSWFEGWKRRAFITHRRREANARREKIAETLTNNGGKLLCEVPNCGFDFHARYGPLGTGYAQVHHLEPLSKSPKEGRRIKLNELAVVCANCHVMIHLGGENRPLKGLIVPATP